MCENYNAAKERISDPNRVYAFHIPPFLVFDAQRFCLDTPASRPKNQRDLYRQLQNAHTDSLVYWVNEQS